MKLGDIKKKLLKREKRICRLYDINAVENEFHFLTQIFLYDAERLVLFNHMMNLNGKFVLLNDIGTAKWILLQEGLVMFATIGTDISSCFEERTYTVRRGTFLAVGIHKFTYMYTVHFMFSCLCVSCDLCVYLFIFFFVLLLFMFSQSNICSFYIPARDLNW